MLNKKISQAREIFYSTVEPIYLEEARERKLNDYLIKDDNPLVSVYVPTYNRSELLLDRAVKSVLAQTYSNFEFIIIGDSCTDNTEHLVKQIDLSDLGHTVPPISAFQTQHQSTVL